METTKVYTENLRCYLDGKRVIANRGGTRSGKTYSIVSLLITIATVSKTSPSIDIVSESLPHLKKGAMHDFEEIISNENVPCEINKTDHTYTFPSGSVVRFFSADASNKNSWFKVKGSRRDVLFINECNHIPFEIYRQLSVRTKSTIFLDWNPDQRFWYDEKLMGRNDVAEIHSTYKDNPFLPSEQIADIESNMADENWWKVYGMGLTGQPVGLIYSRWTQVDAIPEQATIVATGVDFGFTNDPTAIIHVYKHEGMLWLDEACYERGLTNDKIADRLHGVTHKVVADSAEMKSITELHNYGVRFVESAKKGADSVRAGIQILQRYEMRVTSSSLNLINELRNYKWDSNKITGEVMNVPVDKFNHALDAVRYVALNCLSERPVIKRPKAKVGRI